MSLPREFGAEGERDADGRLESFIGAQIRELRSTLGLTMTELADSAEISVGMLSKIENGQTSASLSTLQRLATSLNIPIASFFSTFDEKREATFVKAGEGLPIERRGSRKGHLYQLLGHSLRNALSVEPFLITLDQDSDAHPIFSHPGVEFIYMLEGSVAYRHGNQVYELEPGDSLFFDSDVPHGPLELLNLPTVFLSVIVAATE